MGIFDRHNSENWNLLKQLTLYLFQADYYKHILLLNLSVFFPVLILVSGIVVLFLLLRWLYIFNKTLTEQSILLELTPPSYTDKSAYATSQLYSVIHGLGHNRTVWKKLIGIKPKFSFEIVSTKKKGIRYMARTTPYYAKNLKRYILSYLPQVRVKVTDDYLIECAQEEKTSRQQVVEFRLKKHFAYPLKKQDSLEAHDPVAYITGMMTKLTPGELISIQIVFSPAKINEISYIKRMILRNDKVLAYLDSFRVPTWIYPIADLLKVLSTVIYKAGGEISWALSELSNPHTQPAFQTQNYAYQQSQIQQQIKPARTLSSFEQMAIQSVQEKIDQPLFEATIRLFILVHDDRQQQERVDGFISSLESFGVPGYQSLVKNSLLSELLLGKIRILAFKKRLLSFLTNSGSSLLSASEIADLYHFPYSNVTQTENIVKVYSKELPAPLFLKQGTPLDVVFGKNTYGGVVTEIGETIDQRKTHMYIVGRTGSGKTTLMFSLAKHDIEAGRGLAFIDPHGDVSEDLLASIPIKRKDDLIYLNPWDIKHPIGINVMELTDGLDEDGEELEKEVVCEGVISLFKKVFSKDENANAHRIEHILRNTIYTAFYVPDRTLFTIGKLLTDASFRKQTLSIVDDEDLLNFWKSEFGRAGDYQIVKMTQGVTAKVGRFLRSPTARRMLEQPKSTINFNDILNGKILLCNLSQGKLGEDTTKLIGTTILTKLQQATLRRTTIPQDKRNPFYLYIDEFQNFATLSFIKIVSEGRKYGLNLIMAEQSTSQQQEQTIVNQVLANVTTVIVFRSGNYLDEELMLNQFAPYLEKGDIMNLPRYRFYIKISALVSEEPFSGITIYYPVVKDQQKIAILTAASQKNWAIVYVKPKRESSKKNEIDTDKNKSSGERKNVKGSGLPKRKSR